MARNLLRKLCVPCPLERPKHMKKWFKLVAAKKKDSAVTRNEKRLSLHRKNQMMVKREKRKSKRQQYLKAYVSRVGKENRKHKLCRAQCCDHVEKRVSECHHSNPDLWRETVVVSSTGVALAVAAFSHDHSYPQTSFPAPSLSLFQCTEDSLENLLDTCVVDVNFLQEAKSSHDVLFEEVLNHCDVPPDEMFTDIEGDAISNHVVPVPSCWCCLAYSRSAPTQGIFTMAGSTETQLSTCVFPRTRLPPPLALSEKDVQHSVGSQSRPPLKGWMPGEESLSSEDTSASFGVPVFFGSPPATDGASPRVDQGRSSEGAKSGDNWVRVLEQVFKEVAPDNCLGNAGCKSSPPDGRSGNSNVCGEVGDTVTTSHPRSRDSPSSPQVVGSCVAPHVTHCERVRNIGCGASSHSGSIDSCGGDACLASPPPRSSSCPLLHSVPSFPVQSESSLKASAVASSCRKRRQESGNERSGKRCKTAGQETSWTSSLEADTTTHSSDTHSYQDIPSPPSLSPCWDLPIFHTLPTPLSPLSDDARVMGSDDDVVTLGNTLDDVDDKVAVTSRYGAKNEVTSTMEEVERRTGCVTGSGKNYCASSSTDVQKDMSLRSGDGAVGLLSAYEASSCLDSHLKLFPKALPLSPIANTQFDRCV